MALQAIKLRYVTIYTMPLYYSSSNSCVCNYVNVCVHNYILYTLVLSSSGKDILIRCLLRLPDPSIVFSHQITLLQWSYSQPLLRHSITKQWVSSVSYLNV